MSNCIYNSFLDVDNNIKTGEPCSPVKIFSLFFFFYFILLITLVYIIMNLIIKNILQIITIIIAFIYQKKKSMISVRTSKKFQEKEVTSTFIFPYSPYICEK